MEKRISVAPMMGQTDRHFRYMISLLANDVRLYTPMIHADAIVYSDKNFIKNENHNQKAVGIQIAGSDPDIVTSAAKIIEQHNYNEINLNVGCPSARVQNCSVGATLMKEPQRVAKIIERLKKTTNLPVSIKTRIGVDDEDSYQFLYDFVKQTSSAGCEHFIVHARKAILKGLNPKENRSIPPLNYERVEQLKNDFSDLRIDINGEVNSIEKIKNHLKMFDGVMIGREACKNPFFLAEVQNSFFKNKSDRLKLNKLDFIEQMIEYIKNEVKQGVSAHLITRHMTQLLKGTPGAKQWRNLIGSDKSHKKDIDTLLFELSDFLSTRAEILV